MSAKPKVHHKLGEMFSTAISGNDVLSATLYVAAISIIFAGVLAPLVLILVALVLIFYKSVYREVVEAIPINGGAYNAMLNGTSKMIAAMAGVMTILSYIATAVISAKAGVAYLFSFLDHVQTYSGVTFLGGIDLNNLVIPAIIIVIGLFCLLVITGIRQSAKVALIIFILYIVMLLSFLLVGFLFIFNNGIELFFQNALHTGSLIQSHGGVWKMLFLAFSISIIAIDGYESTADFVEDQRHGVFHKVLRNLFLGVLFFNPLVTIIILGILPLGIISGAKDSLLNLTALTSGGIWFEGWIALSAFLVLSGAVLTSVIGASGLVKRMALDECLPSELAKENRWGARPRIVIWFFILCVLIVLVTKGNLLSLAGLDTIAFLAVMTLFALGNLLLRVTRKDLKRPYHGPFINVICASAATIIAIVGNLFIDRNNIIYFCLYFIPATSLVMLVIHKREVIKTAMHWSKMFPPLYVILMRKYEEIINTHIYVFIHHTGKLYRILEYIDLNESGCDITLVHCANDESEERKKIQEAVPALKAAGAFNHFNIGFEYIDAPFGPAVVHRYAREKNIPLNKIFIGSIHHTHEFDLSDLGGVRIIS